MVKSRITSFFLATPNYGSCSFFVRIEIQAILLGSMILTHRHMCLKWCVKNHLPTSEYWVIKKNPTKKGFGQKHGPPQQQPNNTNLEKKVSFWIRFQLHTHTAPHFFQEKYSSNWIISPNRSENKKCLSCHHLDICSFCLPFCYVHLQINKKRKHVECLEWALYNERGDLSNHLCLRKVYTNFLSGRNLYMAKKPLPISQTGASYSLFSWHL